MMSFSLHRQQRHGIAALLVAVTGILGSCAEDSGDNSVADIAQETLQAEADHPSNSSLHGLAAFDESIPLTASESYWYLKDDLQSLSDTSALGFVGRITGYVESIKTLPYSDDTPAEDRGYDVYDGIVFSVDELLTGELDPSTGTVTVATRTLVLNPDATPRFRIREESMETVLLGIEGRHEQDGPSYLVYVTEDQETYSPFYNSGYYFFNTPGGVAPMLDGERIGNAADRPLARPVVVEDGVYRQIDHGLTLADARAVGRVVDSGNSPSTGGDASDPFDDLTPGDTGPVGVADE